MLYRKAIRAIWENKKAYIACIVLIAIGVMMYVSMSISSMSLQTSTDNYYKEYNLADVFAKVEGMPSSGVDSLKSHEGIEDVLGRIIYDSRVIIEDSEDIINLRLISDDGNPETTINNYLLVEGEPLSEPNDILVAESFLNIWGLEIGDPIKVVINSKEYIFNICGAIQSPEYVYAVKDAKQLIPDPGAFNIAYLQEETLANALGKQGIYNDISFILEDGYTYDDVKVDLRESLEEFGVTELVEKEDQASYAMLDNEISSLNSFSKTLPAVFILMSTIILYLMLKRVIEQDRSQIGTLKAFGYSNFQIINHYLIYGGVTGFFGGVLGNILGYPLSGYFLESYNTVFDIPNLVAVDSFMFMIYGIIVALVGGLAGAFMGTYNILKLSPSEAMRPVAPKPIKHDVLLKIPFLRSMLTSRGNMAVRSIERNKVRSFFIILGIMFSFSIMAFMASYTSMIDAMMEERYEKTEIYDAKVTLNHPIDYDSGVAALEGAPGVTEAEGLLEVPAEIKHLNNKAGTIIMGVTQEAELFKIYDSDKKDWIPPPTEGIALSSTLAEDLEVDIGEVVYINSGIIEEDLEFVVTDIVTQNFGGSAYIDKTTLENAMGTEDSATSLTFNSTDMSATRDYLLDSQNVASIVDKQSAIENFREMMEPYMGIFKYMQLMGIIVAFAIIYNTSTISLSERKREYATLRVLGLHVKEVGEILSFEYWILLTFGVIAGIPFTRYLKIGMNNALTVETFSIPVDTPMRCFIIAGINCIIAVAISNMLAKKNISKFDMVEVLKERE